VQTIIEIVIGVVVVLALSGALFLRARGRREVAERPPTQVLPRPGAPAGRGETSVEELDAGLAGPDTDTLPADTLSADAFATDTALAPEVAEIPTPAAGRLVRLRTRLARSESTLGRGLLALLSRDTIDEETWDEVEELLLTADIGVTATTELVDSLRTQVRVLGSHGRDDVRRLLHDSLVDVLDPKLDRTLATTRSGAGPAVVLVVGVNGTGKTTTVGKLARLLVAEGRQVVLGAADTFRAAAADQLQTWGRRVGAQTVRGPEGGDPASVAFDAVKTGIELEADTVLIDTAGRLHTKAGLMDELGKVKRVVEKHGPVDEVLLVLDATTGQNGLVQARVFTEVVAVTGVVLTKLDGTAKGGIVVSVQRELGVPVKLIGLGEGPDDLAPFEPEPFVDALLGE
jgi:fused signal recognition particle receptor